MGKFEELTPLLMEKLMKEFGLKEFHAAGIVGNGAHESMGFTVLREIGQPNGKGGYGWFQWTGPRREQFLGWCKQNSLDWQGDEANTGFLIHELKTTEKSSIKHLLTAKDVDESTKVFERYFEAAGTPRMDSRLEWAHKALAVWQKSQLSKKTCASS